MANFALIEHSISTVSDFCYVVPLEPTVTANWLPAGLFFRFLKWFPLPQVLRECEHSTHEAKTLHLLSPVFALLVPL